MLNCVNRCILTALLISAGVLSLAAAPETGTLESLSIQQLEQRLSEIDSQLGELAHNTPRGGFGRVGYRSAENPTVSLREPLSLGREGAI
tara:strand:- start:381 stop:650 length:270 start_codon:yes stop_codon:yes gene_type:complete